MLFSYIQAETLTLLFVIFPWLLSILGSAAIGYNRNRLPEGLAFGLLLGPLGMILTGVALPVRYRRRCPECRFGIPTKATRCGHCGAHV